MRKRILSVVVALCLIVGMCPIFASAGGRAYTYVFDSNGVRKNVATPSAAAGTSAGGTTISSEGNGWAWDKATNTLTLSGADFTESSGMMSMLFYCDATIHLADGSQNVVSASKGSNAGAGIYCIGNLTITGKGSLDLRWTGETGFTRMELELEASKKLLITDGKITAQSLRGKDKIQVAGGNVTVNSIGYCPLDVEKGMETGYENKKVSLSVSGGNLSISELKGNPSELLITGGTVSVTENMFVFDSVLSVKNGTLNITQGKMFSHVNFKSVEIDNANVNSNVYFQIASSDTISIKNVSGASVAFDYIYTGPAWNGSFSHSPWEGAPVKIVAKSPFTPVDPPKPPKPTVAGFSDVYEDDYYADAVKWAVENEVTSGTGDGKFSPGNSCTRGQIVTFLWNAAGKPEPKTTSNPFTDVKSSDYYYKAVLWAVENDITSGTGENSFSPNNSCTRNQAVTFLWRAEGKPGVDSGNAFIDVESGSYYEDAVNWAVENKITSGTSANQFSPGQVCIRGQIVTFLYRTKK